MKKPDKIKIGDLRYKIQFCNDIYSANDHRKLYGEIDYKTQVIKIDKTSTQERIKNTLLHEVIHGLNDGYVLDIEEKTIDLLATSLINLIIDNKKFFEYLLGNDEL